MSVKMYVYVCVCLFFLYVLSLALYCLFQCLWFKCAELPTRFLQQFNLKKKSSEHSESHENNIEVFGSYLSCRLTHCQASPFRQMMIPTANTAAPLQKYHVHQVIDKTYRLNKNKIQLKYPMRFTTASLLPLAYLSLA